MSELNWSALVSQGRAKYHGVPWTPEENEALHMLVRERGLARVNAANFIRDGIVTLEDYDAALAAGVQPETLEERERRVFSAAPKVEPVVSAQEPEKKGKGRKKK